MIHEHADYINGRPWIIVGQKVLNDRAEKTICLMSHIDNDKNDGYFCKSLEWRDLRVVQNKIDILWNSVVYSKTEDEAHQLIDALMLASLLPSLPPPHWRCSVAKLHGETVSLINE